MHENQVGFIPDMRCVTMDHIKISNEGSYMIPKLDTEIEIDG